MKSIEQAKNRGKKIDLNNVYYKQSDVEREFAIQ